MPSGARWKGKAEMRGKVITLTLGRIGAVQRAQRLETEIEATECRRITPVDKGNLVGTIHVTGPEREGNRIKTSIVAGGPAADYAVIVHEDLEADHSRSNNPNGQAKYIEQPLMESKPFMAERIAKTARKL